MPFPPPIHGVLQGPGPPSYTPQSARIMPVHTSNGTALYQGLKRKSDQIENAEGQPNASRSRPSPEKEVIRDNGRLQEDNRAGEGETASRPIDVEETRNVAMVSRYIRAEEEKSHRHHAPESSSQPTDIEVDRDKGGNGVERSHLQEREKPSQSGTLQRTATPDRRMSNDREESNKEHLTEAEVCTIPSMIIYTELAQRKLLLTNVAKVEAMLEREKWNLVAEAMKLAGAPEYPGAFLEQEYKEVTRHLGNLTTSEVDRPVRVNFSSALPERSDREESRAGDIGSSTVSRHREVDTASPPNEGSNVASRGQFPSPAKSQLLGPVPQGLRDSHSWHEPAEAILAMHPQFNRRDHQGFGMLVNEGPLQYNPQQDPENVRARMAEQENDLQTQGPDHSKGTAPRTPSLQTPLHATNVPDQQPTTQRPLQNGSVAQDLSQAEAPRLEASLSINRMEFPSIHHTSTGAPVFDEELASSTTIQNRATSVSPYNAVERSAEVPNAVTEAPYQAATQPKAGTSFVSVNESWDKSHDDQISDKGGSTSLGTPSNTGHAFVSVNEPHVERHSHQSLDRQPGPVIISSPDSPSNTRTAFVSVNESGNGRQCDQSLGSQPARVVVGAAASAITPSNTGSAFVSINESSPEKQGSHSLERMKWEETDTRSRPRLANDKVAVLEREFQQDPKPTKEYKEELAKTLDTTCEKINNWYSNRRSKATTQAKQIRALQEARRNSSTVDPSPIESSRAISTPVTEATPETEHFQHSSHATQAPNNLALQVKAELLETADTPNFTPEQSTPVTPSSQSASTRSIGQPQPNPTPDSHETRSSAMRAAWARRKAEGRNGRDGGAPKHSTTVQHALMGGSPVAFAAQILAAAEAAQKSASPTPKPALQDSESLPSPSPTQSTPDNFAKAIGISESPGTTAYSQLGRQRGLYKKRNVSGLAATHSHDASSQFHSSSLSGQSSPYGYPNRGYQPSESPEIRAATSITHPFACEKCGKAYQQFAGLKYHKEHYPNCEAAPPRTDKRTDPAERIEARKANGARTPIVEAWPAVNTAGLDK